MYDSVHTILVCQAKENAGGPLANASATVQCDEAAARRSEVWRTH